MDAHLRRRLGGIGLLFIALFALTSFVMPGTNSRWSPAKATQFYAAHQGTLRIEAYGTVIAIVVGLAFFWYLRELLATSESARSLATIGFGGIILFAASGGLNAGVEFALADVANHASGSTIQTLNVFNTDVGSMVGAGGVAAFLLTTGIVVVRTGVLAKWLGWVGIVLGVASLALPFAGGAGAALWTLIASIVLIAGREPVTVGSGAPMAPLPVT